MQGGKDTRSVDDSRKGEGSLSIETSHLPSHHHIGLSRALHEELPPPISAVPTTDTLGEENSLSEMLRSFATAIQIPPSRQHHQQQHPQPRSLLEAAQSSAARIGKTTANVSAVLPTTPGPPPTANTNKNTVPPGSITPAVFHRTSSATSGSQAEYQAASLRASHESNLSRDFQHPEDLMSVRVQNVNIAQRSAFDASTLPSLDEWWEVAAASIRKSGPSTTSHKHHHKARLSPSLQHLKLLHKIQSMTVIRQLQFSPSTSWHCDAYLNTTNDDVANDPLVMENMPLRKRQARDGRYRAIDPIKACAADLPRVPPLLGLKKVRLPTRADVGFPGATPQEIEDKQREIQNETTWEEASPRLAVLITSEDVGRAVEEEDFAKVPPDESLRQMHEEWNGGGVPGVMPYCGKELLQALDRNARHFGRPSRGLNVRPNPFSMLAPPLEAARSHSQGWRPRPYHDRAPGMTYFLVAPLDMQLGGVFEQEPLSCSLTLYCLPKNGEQRKSNHGKMSEDMWFPMGNWNDELGADTARTKSIAADAPQPSHFRKRKAIFSFNQSSLDDQGPSSLFVVLQVHRPVKRRVTPADGNLDQIDESLWYPLCFGMTALFPQDSAQDMNWPSGIIAEVELHTFPIVPDTQDSFLERLIRLADECEWSKPDLRSLTDIDGSVLLESGDTGVNRRKVEERTPMKPGKNRPHRSTDTPKGTQSTCSLQWASLYLSKLGVDFLTSMLTMPPDLEETGRGGIGFAPRLLADVSGDFGILLEAVQGQSSSYFAKRSDLLRLPKSTEPGAYMPSCDYQEVLYLPARREKQYDADCPLTPPTLPNLLYVYPRVLRKTSDSSSNFDHSNFTLGFRVLRTDQTPTDPSMPSQQLLGTYLPAIYDTCPWRGHALVEFACTKVGGTNIDTRAESDAGLGIRDEIKVRLPDVLGGSYSLEISLYRVESLHANATLRLEAEASVPLSNSAARENVTSMRVATVIPNGNHRIKLGDFQLQMETRLLSKNHIGDPALALLMREFPYEDNPSNVTPDGAILTPTLSALSTDSDASKLEAFPPLISSASESAMQWHFQELMFLHLANLVDNKEKPPLSSAKSAFLVQNIQNLFKLLTRVKQSISHAQSGRYRDAIIAFMKKLVDLFDEAYLSATPKHFALLHKNQDNEATLNELKDDVNAEESVEDSSFKGGISLPSKPLYRSQRDLRVRAVKHIEALGVRSVPLSRIAFGASKLDRMRIEAELHSESLHYATYFEDDETIATMLSMQTDTQRKYVDSATPGARAMGDDSSGNSILKATSSLGEENQARTTGNDEFVRRVKSVAQVVLAPCVGDGTLYGLIASPRSSQGRTRTVEMRKTRNTKEPSSSEFLCCAGSDVHAFSERSFGETSQVLVKSRRVEPVLIFTGIDNHDDELNLSARNYIYETIIVIWLRAWLRYAERTDRKTQFFYLSQDRDPSDIVFSFFEHLDFLLPLCMKSFVLRVSAEVHPSSRRVTVDDKHMRLLVTFVEVLARGLVGLAFSCWETDVERECSLLNALKSADIVLDFLVGLLSVINLDQFHLLLRCYFNTLRRVETEQVSGENGTHKFQWTVESLHRIRCSRQLRIKAAESFAMLPSFLSLNFPTTHTAKFYKPHAMKSTWLHQYIETRDVADSNQSRPVDDRAQCSGWLSELVVGECLSVCALSCEAVVAEAMAYVKTTHTDQISSSALKNRPGATLMRGDLLMFQALAIHAITCVYELIIRRHMMDRRFQTDSSRKQIAELLSSPILEKSVASVRWLARLESTHKVRSIWLLSFVYILQESPEGTIREFLRSFSNQPCLRLHRFIRLLRLCTSTFQSFADLPQTASEIDKELSPWVLQESYNTICAATNIIVEETVKATVADPTERKKMMQGVLDLLLHLLTNPLSSVTHLRAIGGAIQTIEQFGIELFLEVVGDNLQHWLRVIMSRMNSMSLSVRSIAVDFLVSVLGGTYDFFGSIDAITVVLVTILPEVTAREIALFSVSDQIFDLEDLSQCLWPLRRAIADLEDTNPLDDERVDSELAPLISELCRVGQAVIDGVITEIRLGYHRKSPILVEDRFGHTDWGRYVFDADEESLYEAACFFQPETSPMQKIRWLLTLKDLHVMKNQWVEAGETLFLCARAICDAIPHLKHVWRPSSFEHWFNSRRSMWLEAIGASSGRLDHGNQQVMEFASSFLEPSAFLGTILQGSDSGKLQHPTVPVLCAVLSSAAKEAVVCYLRESHTDELVFSRLETLQRTLMHVVEGYSLVSSGKARVPVGGVARRKHVEEEAALRSVLATIGGDLTRLAENMLRKAQGERQSHMGRYVPQSSSSRHVYVEMKLTGKRPPRFQESTSIPTFLEWESPVICRVPSSVLHHPHRVATEPGNNAYMAFAERFLQALKECGAERIVVLTDPAGIAKVDEHTTCLHVYPIDVVESRTMKQLEYLNPKRFVLRKPSGNDRGSRLEMSVAHSFPFAVSRQRTLLTTELVPVAYTVP